MNTVTASERATISPPADPVLRAIAEDLLSVTRLAAEKAVAHAADPAKYPMPAEDGTLERLMSDHFQRLPNDKQQRTIAKLAAAAAEPATRKRERYGDLAEIDLTSTTPLTTQADAIMARRGTPAQRPHSPAPQTSVPVDEGVEA